MESEIKRFVTMVAGACFVALFAILYIYTLTSH